MTTSPLRSTVAAWMHVVVMVLAYTSPFWLDWRLVLGGVLLYYLQLWVFGGCVLTYAEFGKWEESFTLHYLTKGMALLGIKVPQRATKKVLDALPYLYVVFSFVLQWYFGYYAPIRLWP